MNRRLMDILLLLLLVLESSFGCMKTVPTDTTTATSTTTITSTTAVTGSCATCAANDVSLEELATEFGIIGTLPTISAVTVSEGCNTVTVTCTPPEGEEGPAIMEFNTGIGTLEPANIVTTNLVCNEAGAWQYAAPDGQTLEVTKVACAYAQPCTACEASDITLDPGGYTDENDLLLKTQPTISEIAANGEGCSTTMVTCGLPEGKVGDSFLAFNDEHVASPELGETVTVELTCNGEGEWEYQNAASTPLVVNKIFCEHLLQCATCTDVGTSVTAPIITSITRDANGCATRTATCTAPDGEQATMQFNTDTPHPDGASPTVTADLVCDDTGKWTFDGSEVTTVSCDYTATTSCTSCTADSVALEAQETASGFVGLLPTSSVVTVAGGCNTITITCTFPDGDAVMELNDGATPFAPAPTLAATLVCDGAGAWQYTAGGVLLEVTKISCAYISPCTACEAGDITLDSGGYTDVNDLLLKTQPTLGAITTTAAGCSSVIATCALPDGAVGDSFMEFNDAHIGSPPDLTQPITVDLTCNENGEWEYQFPTASLVVDKLFCSHLLACTSCPAVTTSAPQPLIGGLTRDGDGCATTTATCTAPTGGSSSLTFNGNIPYSGAAAPTVTIDLVCDDTGSWTADGVSLTDVKCVYT